MAQGVGRPEFDELAARVTALERGRGTTASRAAPVTPLDVVGSVAATHPGDGGVLHGGHARLPDGREAVWQVSHGLDELLSGDWDDAEASLRALGHRHRLALVHDLLAEPMTALQLEETGRHGTTGQIYNHLRQLVEAGWLRTERRGVYGVPIQRVVPLLVVISAARGDA